MTATADPGQKALHLRGITAGYGRTTVLRNVDIDVRVGEVTALLGPNGAGKTTTLRVAAGLLAPTRGRVLLDGVDVQSFSPHRRAEAGLCLIPEGRGIFRGLTVADNLRLLLPPWAPRSASYDRAFDAFPILKDRQHQVAGTLSGGQQQMLALARAYLSDPKVVLLDEVSMGLSPIMVDEIFAALRILASSGASLLLVEQYVTQALRLADRVVLLDRGVVAHAGPAAGLDADELASHYLGAANGSTAPAERSRT